MIEPSLTENSKAFFCALTRFTLTIKSNHQAGYWSGQNQGQHLKAWAGTLRSSSRNKITVSITEISETEIKGRKLRERDADIHNGQCG